MLVDIVQIYLRTIAILFNILDRNSFLHLNKNSPTVSSYTNTDILQIPNSKINPPFPCISKHSDFTLWHPYTFYEVLGFIQKR
jgi:hypothetical protein